MSRTFRKRVEKIRSVLRIVSNKVSSPFLGHSLCIATCDNRMYNLLLSYVMIMFGFLDGGVDT